MDFKSFKKFSFDNVTWMNDGESPSSIEIPVYPIEIPTNHPIVTNTLDYLDTLSNSLAFKAWCAVNIDRDIFSIVPSVKIKKDEDHSKTDISMVCNTLSCQDIELLSRTYESPISAMDGILENQYHIHTGKLGEMTGITQDGKNTVTVNIMYLDCRAIPSVKRGGMFSRVEGEVALFASNSNIYHIQSFDMILNNLKDIILMAVNSRIKGFYTQKSYTHDQEIDHWSISYKIEKMTMLSSYCVLKFMVIRNITMDGIEFNPYLIRPLAENEHSHNSLFWKIPSNDKFPERPFSNYISLTISNRVTNASIPYMDKRWIIALNPLDGISEMNNNIEDSVFSKMQLVFINNDCHGNIFFCGNYKEKTTKEAQDEKSNYTYTKMVPIPFSRLQYLKHGVFGTNYKVYPNSVNIKAFKNFTMLSDFWLPNKSKPKDAISRYLHAIQLELVKIRNKHPNWYMLPLQGVELHDANPMPINYDLHEGNKLLTDMILSGEIEKYSIMWISDYRQE